MCFKVNSTIEMLSVHNRILNGAVPDLGVTQSEQMQQCQSGITRCPVWQMCAVKPWHIRYKTWGAHAVPEQLEEETNKCLNFVQAGPQQWARLHPIGQVIEFNHSVDTIQLWVPTRTSSRWLKMGNVTGFTYSVQARGSVSFSAHPQKVSICALGDISRLSTVYRMVSFHRASWLDELQGEHFRLLSLP